MRFAFYYTAQHGKEKEMKLWERVEYSAIIDGKPLRVPNNKSGC
jgi:hypothetical protein